MWEAAPGCGGAAGGPQNGGWQEVLGGAWEGVRREGTIPMTTLC